MTYQEICPILLSHRFSVREREPVSLLAGCLRYFLEFDRGDDLVIQGNR